MTPPLSAGDVIATGSQVIEVRVAELRQLFNAIDPSPFRERDLDPRSDEFIVEWARAAGSRRSLRELFRRGRISLVIAIAFLGASVTLSNLIGNLSGNNFTAVLREGFLIGGWVAMWRPLEVFLYDWWPILGEVRLLDRLSRMPVRIEYKEQMSDDAWRSDWPAVPPSRRTAAAPRVHVNTGSVRRRPMASENTEHQHSPEEERDIREAALDETIEASFPASDPPSSNPNPDDHEALERAPNR